MQGAAPGYAAAALRDMASRAHTRRAATAGIWPGRRSPTCRRTCPASSVEGMPSGSSEIERASRDLPGPTGGRMSREGARGMANGKSRPRSSACARGRDRPCRRVDRRLADLDRFTADGEERQRLRPCLCRCHASAAVAPVAGGDDAVPPTRTTARGGPAARHGRQGGGPAAPAFRAPAAPACPRSAGAFRAPAAPACPRPPPPSPAAPRCGRHSLLRQAPALEA